ncbi:MAG TPA: ATP-binding protein [Candidatus Paceibacterota bacterium]
MKIMHLLTKMTVKNFRGFRDKTVFDLENSSYFVGPNNSGKTTVLNAIRFFFDKDFYIDEDFINKTAFLSKREKSNQAEITIEFNLDNLTVKSFKNDLIKKYGSLLSVSKIISISTDTKVVSKTYKISDSYEDKLPEDIMRLIDSVKITYLHPQEGKELLHNAQEKLKQRLLANWGRNSNISTSIKELQKAWDDLRQKTNKYLSGALTENLQNMWLGSSVTINLPRNIKEIIGVSNISFLGYEGAPEIDLTLQGTGAQATILYLTHFLLDSDRSLHRGEYHPLWLIEEPESFLHADLLANLTRQLNSDKWLNNIQMAISTHSPVLLAGTRLAEKKVNWTVLQKYLVKYNKLPGEYLEKEIEEIGQMMGDPNFYAYFTIFQNKILIFLEDERKITKEAFVSSGIPITEGPSGVGQVKKYLDVLRATPEILQSEAYFVVDADKGKKSDIKVHIEAMKEVASERGFKKLKYDNCNIFIVLLPEGKAVEDLFDEYEDHLNECVDKIWSRGFEIKSGIPSNMSRVVSKARNSKISDKGEAIELIKNEQDVKDLFWGKVENSGYKINACNIQTLKEFLSI